MLSSLDKLLRRILVDGVPLGSSSLVSEEQVFFVPPDKSWRDSTLDPSYTSRLSVHLVDVRENVRLRSNERVERRAGTTLVARRAPYRMDCHYLISVLSSTAAGPPSPPPSQHTLLYEVTSTLIRSQPLIPAKVYPPGSIDLDEWLDFRDIELPMIVNPHEGFPKLAEFWGTLKEDHPWQPVVYVVVTIPVEYQDSGAIELVRRRTTIYSPGVATETFVEIGGVVQKIVQNSVDEPVGRAWVIAGKMVGGNRMELARTMSDDEGKFILKLPLDATELWAAAFGYGVTPSLNVSTTSTTTSTDFTLSFT
jgi:Pvc16 N-terminal domain